MAFTPIQEVNPDEGRKGFTPLEGTTNTATQTQPPNRGFKPLAAQPEAAEEGSMLGYADKAATAIIPGYGFAKDALGLAAEENTTEGATLMNKEGLKTLPEVAAVGLGKWANEAIDLYNRPSEYTGALKREDNMRLRALLDQGVPFDQAYAQIRSEVNAAKAAELQTFDAASQGRRTAANDAMDAARGENPSEALKHAQNIATSLAVTAPSLVVGAATKNLPAALALAGGANYPLAYGESREAGSSDARATVSASLSTVAEVGFEVLPIGGLLKDLGTEPFIKMASKYIAREVATELPTTLTQDIISYAIDNPDKPFAQFAEELKTNLINTAIETPFSAALGGGIAQVIGGKRKSDTLSGDPNLDAKLEQMKAAAESGDTETANVIHQQVMDELKQMGGVDINGQSLNQLTPNSFTEPDAIDPLIEAEANLLQPRADAEMDALLATIPSAPVAPEVANDGTSSVGIDDAFAADQQIGNTRKVMANAPNYEPDANDSVPRSQREILYGDEAVVGKKLGEVKLAPGVTTIGESTLARSDELLSATHEIYSMLQKAYAPNARIVLSGETMATRQAVGMMQRLASGEYVVVPAQARSVDSTNPEMLDARNFNPSTKAKILYNAFHEFGHILAMEQFYGGVAPEAQLGVMLGSKQGQIDDATIAQFAPEAQAVLREYNQFRQDMKKKNAAWFQSEWMGPALAVQRQLITDKGGDPAMSAEGFVRRLVSRGHPKVERLDRKLRTIMTVDERQAIVAEKDALLDELAAEYLSFDEFMAEQFSRYAHDKDLSKGVGLGGQQMFRGGYYHVEAESQERTEGLGKVYAEIQKSLRKLFTALKRGLTLEDGQTYRIKAGVSFDEWVASLSKTSRLMVGTPASVEIVGTKKPRAKKDPRKNELPTQHETLKINALREQVGKGKLTTRQKNAIYKLLDQNAIVAAEERLVKYLEGMVKYQLDEGQDKTFNAKFAGLTEEQALDPTNIKAAENEWAAKGFNSKYFKSFFRNSKVVAADGTPMVVYHATKGDIKEFLLGDAGFHFGNLLAAHARMYLPEVNNAQDTEALQEAVNDVERGNVRLGKMDAKYDVKNKKGVPLPEILTQWNIMPSFVRIENPLEISEDGATRMWYTPTDMANKLVTEGILSIAEQQQIWQAEKAFYASNTRPLPDGSTAPLTLKDMESKAGVYYRYDMFEPLRQMLESKGYDGIVYKNFVEGGTSYVPFRPNQVKVMTAQRTFSGSDKVHYQRDVDVTMPAGLEIDTLSRTLDKYEGMGRTATALRQLAKMQWYVLQLQQLAWIHPEFSFLDRANDAAMQYTATKSRLQALGEKTAQHWMRLGKETDAKLSKALEGELAEGKHWTELKFENNTWSHLPTQTAIDKLKSFGIDITTPKGEAAFQVYLQSKNVLLQQLNAAQVALVRRVAQKDGDAKEKALRINEIRKEFAKMREMPFLPRGDYGSWGLKVYEQQGQKRVVVYRQMFESEKDLVKARELVTKSLKPGQTIVTETNLSDEHKALLALPMEYVELAAEALDLTQGQRDILFDLLHPVKQDRLLQPYAKALEKISGGSKDRMRNFADFVWHNSTMIARTEAVPLLNRAKQSAADMFKEVNAAQMDEKARQRLLEDIKKGSLFLDRTIGYMLTPPNEWYTARSVVALVYLWGSMKTAMLNLVGVITTYSALTSQYGELAGDAALARAHKHGAILLTNGTVSPEIDGLYNKALNEGFLVQSYAAHLAGAATAGATKRLTSRSRWTADTSQAVAWVADKGMLPFTLAEQYTRRVTFLAQVNALLAQAKLEGHAPNLEAIYAEAVKQTDLLQNSYSLANRPQIMRGGTGITSGLVPLMTIFLSFMGHFTFNAAGGYTLGAQRRALVNKTAVPKGVISHTQKMLLLLLLLGGYEALPGAENILDILDALMLNLGSKGKTARQMLREGIKELPEIPGASWVNDPRWWGKGLGGDVLGFDVSGSLGIGRLIPGTDALAGTPTTAEEVFGRLIPSLFGVTGGLAKWSTQIALDAWNGKDITPNITKFPGAVGAVATALDWNERGVRGARGELIHEPTAGEIAGKALNFMPSAVAEKKEVNWAVKQAIDFWTTQKGLLQQQYNVAQDADDREAIADVEAKMEEFNNAVVDPKMRMRMAEVRSNYRQHLRENRKLELGIPPRSARNLSSEVEASFADEEELLE